MSWVIPVVVLASVLVLLGLAQKWNARGSERARERSNGAIDGDGIRHLHKTLAQPAEREPLLGFGALMLERNGHPTRILAMLESKEVLGEGLAEVWDIVDERTAKEAIQGLIAGGRRARYQIDFNRLQDGNSLADLKESFDGKDYLRWRRAKALCARAGLPIDSVGSMNAYDYERIAWLARECHFVGYLSEAEAWRCLAWVACAAQAEFSRWNDYAVSFILGRAATFACDCDDDECCTQRGVDAAKRLLSEECDMAGRPHLWRENPLAGIAVPGGLGARTDQDEKPDAVSCNPLAVREQLLGFGALTAIGCGEPAGVMVLPLEDLRPTESWLADAWGVTDGESANLRLDWLLTSGSRADHDEILQRIIRRPGAATETDGVDASAIVRIRQSREYMVESGMDADRIASQSSLLAYDLERAAYLVRMACTVGYMDQEKAWACLRRIAMLARSTYVTWEDYFAAYVLGVALFSRDGSRLKQLTHQGASLLTSESPFLEYRSMWRKHPLQDMPTLRAVRSNETIPSV